MPTTEQTQDFSRLCMESALKATQCATACIEHEDPSMTNCIKTCLDYAHVAETTGTLTARGSEYARRLTQLCAEIATRCAQQCEEAGDHQAMKDCAEACRAVAKAGEGVAMQQSP